MATVKRTLDKRISNINKDKQYPLVLRIGHKSKTRDIPFNLHLKKNQFDENTGEIKGILKAQYHTKRIQKLFSDADLWILDNKGMIKNWEMERLKKEIEQRFFGIHVSRKILNYGAVYIDRLNKEERFSTASSYEDALKVIIKYRRHLKKEDDNAAIKSLFELDKTKNKLVVHADYKDLDMEIKAMDYAFLRDFKAYMSDRYNSRNTPSIHLRSIQAIMNDACKAFEDLRDHKPLSNIKKQSIENVPIPFTLDEIKAIRELDLKPETPIWDTRNYFLFMFNNMGMNFADLAIIKVSQFEENRIKYFRKKTRTEGDYFSVLQSDEALKIIEYYIDGKGNDEYLFPIIPNGTSPERLYKVNKGKLKIFNRYAGQIAKQAEITKKFTSYTARDTWTNIGLELGVDIRKLSSGLGHSSVQVTEKHYSLNIQEKLLDEINEKITRQ